MFWIDIVFLIVGIYFLRTQNLPDWLIGKDYQVDLKVSRFIGILAILPILMEFFSGLFIGYIFYSNSNAISIANSTQYFFVAIRLIILFISVILVLENRKRIIK